MREGNAERGFTIVELMIVVAIVAILAVIVVPMFTRESRKVKGETEVSAMFTEIASKQEAYKAELNTYLAAPVCPSVPAPAGYDPQATCMGTGLPWTELRLQPPSSTMYCAYTVEIGAAGTTMTAATGFTASAGTMATSWFTIHASCDEDGQGGTNAQFFVTSVDRKIQKLNEAQ